MWMPFRRELDDVFRGDRSIVLKMAGAGLAAAVVVVTATLRAIHTGQIDAEPTPRLIGILAGGSGVAGAGLALLLSLKDTVERRISRAERVHPILRLYFGRGAWSLVAWFPTVIFAAFVVTMAVVTARG